MSDIQKVVLHKRIILLLEYFRSVRIIFTNKENRFLSNDVINNRIDWLNRFDSWYKNETGINDGNNLHFSYHREIYISGYRLLESITALEKFFSSCSHLDVYSCLRISLEECYEFYSDFDEIIRKFNLSSIVIEADDISLEKYQSNFLISLVEKLTLNRINLSFIGSIPFWLQKGIGRSQTLNSSVYNIIPQSKKLKRHFFGTHNPCAKKFMFVIDYDGLIYPCVGLLGIDSCSIGKTNDPLSLVWKSIKHHSLNIEKLAYQGPNLDLQAENFSSICEAHRALII